MPDEQTRQEDQRRALLAAYRLVRSDMESRLQDARAHGGGGQLPLLIRYMAGRIDMLSYAE